MQQPLAIIALWGLIAPLAAAADAGPSAITPAIPIAAPKDQPYPGEIRLAVDASDLDRRIMHVHESISVVGAETVLLYPKWLPGTHAPEGPIDKLAGIKMTAGGVPVAWTRDPADVFALRVHARAGTHAIDVDFDFLSPTSGAVGPLELTHNLLMVDWNEVVLYPAGYYARRIAVTARLTLPPGWQFATALESDAAIGTAAGGSTAFRQTDLETLIDSPVYAGRYFARLDLDPGAAAPVHLNLFADRTDAVVVRPDQLAAHRALVQQALKLFGSHHYAHYDFLYSVSDQMQQMGLEHQQSSENGADPDAFTEWDKNASERDLLPHEFTHSWNGKFRRPADLWTPNYNEPMRDSLLWVYEGQTEYWGEVLAARSGLRTRQQALDDLALTAAYFENETGRRWRALQDTTNDEIINPRRPLSWRDWQRFEDYYSEGALIWLEADVLIRERSHARRSLDDFARAFFGINDGSAISVTYTFDDIVRALNSVEAYDWRTFLRSRLDGVGAPAPLDGLRRGGYRLVYTDAPSDYQKTRDAQRKQVNLMYSIGLNISYKEEKGFIAQVLWDGPAFKAKLTEGSQVLAVNGLAYSPDVLKDAVRSARSDAAPIELIVKAGDRFRVAQIEYRDGLRFPHLERDASVPALLDEILTPRQ